MAKGTNNKKKTELERFREKIIAIKNEEDANEGVSERVKLEAMNDLKELAEEKGASSLTFSEVGDKIDSIEFDKDQIEAVKKVDSLSDKLTRIDTKLDLLLEGKIKSKED